MATPWLGWMSFYTNGSIVPERGAELIKKYRLGRAWPLINKKISIVTDPGL
jgi:hypothetical protein